MENNWANENREIASELRRGSGTYAMEVLRAEFAKRIPYDHEHFHRHFSLFATEAVAMDLRANRYCYPIGGVPPNPGFPIEDQPPYIQPTQLLQANQTFLRATGDQPGSDEIQQQVEENRGGQINPALPAGQAENPDQTSGEARERLEGEGRTDLERSNRRNNNIHDAVLNVCWELGKDPDFPDALVQDVLQYKFIHLEKINAGPNTPNFSITSKSKDSDPASKVKPKPFKEATEWRDAVHLLVNTLLLAFDCAEDSFRKYDKHLKIMERTFRERGDWRDVIPYDIALRKAFATRRHLSFADFAGDELAHLKHLALGDRRSYRDTAYTNKGPTASSSMAPRSATSWGQVDKKPKTEHPWAGKVKHTKHLPRCEQICGGWNLDKCPGEKCSSGRIHGMCDYVDCYLSHKRITHSS
ncbi:hypothetical protein DFH28DRAFT_1143548 [Melampsora americana]|nr:hypothetical protein DFH28DRAFT_1143548 [Melampsora americana]